MDICHYLHLYILSRNIKRIKMWGYTMKQKYQKSSKNMTSKRRQSLRLHLKSQNLN